MIPKLSMYEEKSVAAFFCFEFMYLIEANVASKKWRLDIDLDEERRYEMECGTADDGQRQPGRESKHEAVSCNDDDDEKTGFR